MKRKFGIVCMILGALMVFCALGLFLRNNRETEAAETASAAVLPEIKTAIQTNAEKKAAVPENEVPNTPPELLTPEELAMTESVIAGRSYIGYLYIPVLELELPVLSDWSYHGLRIAPARYYGTLRGEDLVILAHNYPIHFGRLSELLEGDSVVFTDMDGRVWNYEVVAKDILLPTAVEEMTAGAYDLTLFTCTYGGQNRVTVFCDLVRE